MVHDPHLPTRESKDQLVPAGMNIRDISKHYGVHTIIRHISLLLFLIACTIERRTSGHFKNTWHWHRKEAVKVSYPGLSRIA